MTVTIFEYFLFNLQLSLLQYYIYYVSKKILFYNNEITIPFSSLRSSLYHLPFVFALSTGVQDWSSQTEVKYEMLAPVIFSHPWMLLKSWKAQVQP